MTLIMVGLTSVNRTGPQRRWRAVILTSVSRTGHERSKESSRTYISE